MAHNGPGRRLGRSGNKPYGFGGFVLARAAIYAPGVFFAPFTHQAQNRFQRATEIRHPVFDAWRNLRVNLARNNTIAFELAQLLRQHSLRDAGYCALQFTEALGVVPKMPENHQFPFSADDAQSDVGWADILFGWHIMLRLFS